MEMVTHVVKPGENLATIAKRYYGTEDAWAYIWRHNRHEFTSPNDIPYGSELVIPHVPGREFVPC